MMGEMSTSVDRFLKPQTMLKAALLVALAAKSLGCISLFDVL